MKVVLESPSPDNKTKKFLFIGGFIHQISRICSKQKYFLNHESYARRHTWRDTTSRTWTQHKLTTTNLETNHDLPLKKWCANIIWHWKTHCNTRAGSNPSPQAQYQDEHRMWFGTWQNNRFTRTAHHNESANTNPIKRRETQEGPITVVCTEYSEFVPLSHLSSASGRTPSPSFLPHERSPASSNTQPGFRPGVTHHGGG